MWRRLVSKLMVKNTSRVVSVRKKTTTALGRERPGQERLRRAGIGWCLIAVEMKM